MSEIRMWAFWRAVVAELLGMTVFVFIGLSAAVGGINNTYPDQEIKVALAFGLAVATLAQCLGHISGAHLNPAITLGMLVNCQMSVFRALFYVMAQMLGALAGSGIVYGIRPKTIESLGVNKLNGISPGQGFGVEFLLTLQLVLCVLAVTDKRRDVNGFAPLAIGLSVGLGHLAGISYTGCGINPARSFGPAVIQNSFEDHWMLGAVTASAIVNGFKRSGSLGVNMLASDVSVGQGFTIEFLATFQLVLCVIAVTDKRRRDVTGSAPLAIGLSVGLGHFAAISFTGCGINPARSFGPAVIRSVMKNHWVYWLGPMCGGVAAALLYDFILYPRTVNLRSRRNVLLHGPEDDTNETEVTEGGNSSPGPSQWPKQ